MRPTEIRIYYEGSKALKPGFDRFFDELKSKARNCRCQFALISGGPGSETCRDFATALKTHEDAWNILLVDSEGPDNLRLSDALCERQGWAKSRSGSIFWMVEMMESWFHSDKDALEIFYGSQFNQKSLKPNPKVEEIPKADLVEGLRNATRACPKGYFENKASHGGKILELLDPDRVRRAAPKCKKLFDAISISLSYPPA